MNLRQIDAALAAYRTELEEGENVRLAFFRHLWEVQQACATSAEDLGYEIPNAAWLRDVRAVDEPVFHAAPVSLNEDAFVRALVGIGACAIERGGFPPSMQKALSSVAWDRIVAASPLAEAGHDPAAYLDELLVILMDDGMGEGQAHTATLLASFALRSQIEATSAALMDALEQANALASHPLACPICGGAPAVAHVGGEAPLEGRAKALWCPQCGASWEFERVRCARCGTQNQTHLHYFNIEGDDAHRIATCDECGGYIRTVYAEDALAPFSFEVEDIVMTRLDAIARDPSFAGGKHA